MKLGFAKMDPIALRMLAKRAGQAKSKRIVILGSREHPTGRECNYCHQILLFDAFSKSNKGWKGYSAKCKECERKFRAGEHKFNNAFRLYKIRKNDYIALAQSQNGKCAICEISFETGKNTLKNQCIDHDHKTGVRGLLCRRCNLGLGYFNDELLMSKAIEYVKSKKGIARTTEQI